METVVKWFIFVIVIVFDPLAVALVLCYNISINRKEKEEIIEIKPQIKENIIKPIENNFKNIYENFHKTFKRGTKKVHNEPLHDPNIKQNQ
jgi:p-aminobenzoyl-glutamate transporter AbgT